ncbi:hypothetical protein [Dyadobacter bucti]
MSELVDLIRQKRPLDTIDVTVLRENEILNFIVEIQVI